MKVLICGGRDYASTRFLRETLDRFHAVNRFALVITGGQTGADALAETWAEDAKITVCTFRANFRVLGRPAGPIRNAAMLHVMNPDMVIAFPGGPGTADMVSRALRVPGLPVQEIRE